jgi:hypothetical protein
MPNFNLSFDMRTRDFGTPIQTLYAEALEIVQYWMHAAWITSCTACRKAYAELTAGASSSFAGMNDVKTVKATGIYRVVTPEECIKLAAQADSIGADFGLAPTIAGLDPKIGWENLELFHSRCCRT